MDNKYIIRNSVSSRRARGVILREVKSSGRAGDAITFQYLDDGNAKQPSTPADVLLKEPA